MKKQFLVPAVIIVIILGVFWYKMDPTPKKDEAPVVQPTTITLVTPPTSFDQAELYLDQNEEGIKVLEELGVK
ncbi:MAG: hypothetical protein A2821_01910 [Candidatus Magasanikbacteria bacterium RIFCSPHIGHO2_01_FULL_41_23]|uniref:Uncharacterized protein n=1 Tax=Candidatus Magasanikbacteria bacterium RIFCSPLOWO2_01_FULL_40_15 TaxID=1798686 RepID=A0A1F6N371_9BACT|nr:MAG: hypothetical protein A2821_01910 [Candidatus Magasanikbacteria bacterium RIFCSPHIGHO2_01_FULL_41_23]OGH67102.1 MAG: hypothetical protein A3C66_00215 [Candidatus Magasanikbacteria bacterium RIFCSPHIGHO2_02_FULL_41_35]OGH76422.1 MAG: hypothetical protein A3F22_02385 [Candidatus Magasanikbacteria bacterium RIFCSPHIGHO2_12_FULL_41_16]OGH78369.1 MAG: hypothetical protein A2983_00160 [Candidatus Magasanikbacteria bacterium RIFCSPLOWO2_01_FULL_40_15]